MTALDAQQVACSTRGPRANIGVCPSYAARNALLLDTTALWSVSTVIPVWWRHSIWEALFSDLS